MNVLQKILVVEDDRMLRDILARRLKLEGFEVCTAQDGARGVQLARIERPNLIVMDMGLPVCNGWQATHRIRSMPVIRTTPIIALTAYVLKEDRIRCLVVGCDEYEVKPVDFDRLLQKIHRLLKNATEKECYN
jgi:DNA-binding response OmpR family regulator